MFKGTMSGLLTTAFLLVITSAVNGAMIYVPDDYSRIQWAHDNASQGDVIVVRDGFYMENVVISKQITMTSENGSMYTFLIPENPNSSVFKVFADNVTVSGFSISGVSGQYKAGIYVSGAEGCLITGNEIFSSYNGIRLMGSDSCIIFGNTIHDTIWGIALMSGSSNNLIEENIVYNVTGSFLSSGIYLYPAHSNRIANNTVYGSTNGIYLLMNSENNILTGNMLFGNVYSGIAIKSSSNNTINNSIIMENENGILIMESSSSNRIFQNTVENNTNGAYISESTKNNFSDNSLFNNTVGMYFTSSSQNTVSSNDLSWNLDGIYFRNSDKNLVTANVIFGNSIGIKTYNTSGILIYANTFTSNSQNAYPINSENIWNSTDLYTYIYNGSQHFGHLGNFWDDYPVTGSDEDGVGDMAYQLDVNNTDFHPLLKPFENYQIISVAETIPDMVDDASEQLVSKYHSSFDWKTQTPTKDDALQAVVSAVTQYFISTDDTAKQEIVDDVIQLVVLYFLI